MRGAGRETRRVGAAAARQNLSRLRTGAVERAEYVAILRREVFVVTARTAVRGATDDPDDDAVLAAAVDGGARYLVTGDRALADLGSFRGVDIVRPHELLEVLKSGPSAD